MKLATAMILAAFAIVPSLANVCTSSARDRLRAEQTAAITAKFAAAKAACPDCYRVVVTNGVYVGMTRPQYDAYISEKDKKQVAPVYKPMNERPRFQRSKNRIHNRKDKRKVAM